MWCHIGSFIVVKYFVVSQSCLFLCVREWLTKYLKTNGIGRPNAWAGTGLLGGHYKGFHYERCTTDIQSSIL